MDHYGSETPPNYDLGQVTAPTAIFFGEKDDLVTILLNCNGGRLLWSWLILYFGWQSFIQDRLALLELVAE